MPTPDSFNPLDEAGETEAPLGKGGSPWAEYTWHLLNLRKSVSHPSLGWGLQISSR